MKFFTLILALLSFHSQAQNGYRASIDLNRVTDDQLPVELITPSLSQEVVEYHLPKIVPGTYSISDFGRFVTNFTALSQTNDTLEVERISTNRWKISGATQLHKITYWVHDTFDDFSGYGRNRIFEPGGTNIEAESNVFLLNTFGFIGYLDGHKFKSFEVSITHDTAIFGASSLKKRIENDSTDIFSAENYNFLADGPIMYCVPDTATVKIAGANLLVSVYSPNNVLKAEDVLKNIDDLMKAQSNYLGGELPVDRYAYLIYLFDRPPLSGGWGALEHSYSSLYTLPEMDPARIGQIVRNVAAHEFFHIVTPLNLHSEEIHDFNYIEPEMSQHLWLYEGVTEYAAQHVQLKYGLYGMTDFLNEMRNKIQQQERYNVDIPYTKFSEEILKPKNEARYVDVYAGGALIAWCLDLTIIKSTNGEKDLQQVIRELSEKYGPMKAFKDEELFDEIEAITNPQVGAFLRTYIGAANALPYSEIFEWAGISYQRESNERLITSGKFHPGTNDDGEIYVSKTDQMNNFGYALGLKEGDVILEWNGIEINAKNFPKTMQSYYETAVEGEKVTVLVRREALGKSKKVKLKAKAQAIKSSAKYIFEVQENLSPSQQLVRNAWIGK